MSIAVSNLIYGWAYLASLTVGTGTVFVAGNDLNRITTKDRIEVFLAIVGRCYATMYGANPALYYVAPPVIVRTWTDTNGASVIVTNSIEWRDDLSMKIELDVKIEALPPYYVDTNSVYDGVTNFSTHTFTGLLASLDLGNHTNFTEIPAIGTNIATYGPWGWRNFVIAWQERYKFLNKLEQTLNTNVTQPWNELWQGEGHDSNSAAGAYANAVTNYAFVENDTAIPLRQSCKTAFWSNFSYIVDSGADEEGGEGSGSYSGAYSYVEYLVRTDLILTLSSNVVVYPDIDITLSNNWFPLTTNWTEVDGLPAARFELASATFDGNIYAIGGYATNVYRYNGSTWTEVAGLPASRAGLAAATLGSYMYAIGGGVTNVYRYNGSTWTEVAGLPAARTDLAAATLGSYMYAMGGALAETNVYRYDGSTWTEVAGLPVGRGYLAAATFDGNIYAIGGNVTNVYRYNGSTWTEVAGLPAVRYELAAATLGSYMYAMGGDSGVTNVYKYPDVTGDYAGDDCSGLYKGRHPIWTYDDWYCFYNGGDTSFYITHDTNTLDPSWSKAGTSPTGIYSTITGTGIIGTAYAVDASTNTPGLDCSGTYIGSHPLWTFSGWYCLYSAGPNKYYITQDTNALSPSWSKSGSSPIGTYSDVTGAGITGTVDGVYHDITAYHWVTNYTTHTWTNITTNGTVVTNVGTEFYQCWLTKIVSSNDISCTTSIEHQVGYWIKPDSPTIGTTNIFNDEGIGLTEDVWNEEDTYAWSFDSNAPVDFGGTIAIPPVDTVEPTNVNESTCTGFIIDSINAISANGFQYCTNKFW